MEHVVGLRLVAEKQETTISPDGSIDVFVPISFKRTGGRKLIMTPCQPAPGFMSPQERDSLVSAIIRAFQWKEQLETGECTSLQDLANKLKISHSYICRVFRLTLLAPDIIE